MDFLSGNRTSRRAEYPVPGASTGLGRGQLWVDGFADIVDFANGDVYEIKSQRTYIQAPGAALRQLDGYVDGLNQASARAPAHYAYRPPPTTGTWRAGATYLATEVKSFGLWPFGIDPTYNPVRDGFYEIKATLSNHLGLVIYWPEKISEQRARLLVPRYAPDQVLGFIDTTYPQRRRPTWGQGRLVPQLYPGMTMFDASYWCNVTGDMLLYYYEELGRLGNQILLNQPSNMPLLPGSSSVPVPVLP